MAKRRRKTTGRRIGQPRVKKSGLTELLAVGAGLIAGRFIAKKVREQFPNVDGKISAAGQVALGLIAQKAKNPLVRSAALGVAAGGAVSLVENFGVLNGIGNTTQLIEYRTGKTLGNFKTADVVGQPTNARDLKIVAGVF